MCFVIAPKVRHGQFPTSNASLLASQDETLLLVRRCLRTMRNSNSAFSSRAICQDQARQLGPRQCAIGNSRSRALEACTLLSSCGLCIFHVLETTVNKCVVWETSKYVQTYLDLSHGEVSVCFVVLSLARATESLALVAVACCLFGCFYDFFLTVLLLCFTFSPAQWASPQLNRPVQHCVYKLIETVH